SVASQSSRFEQLPNNITVPVQFRTENWQLRTENCFSAPSKFYGQAERAISTGKLHALLHFHLQPINQVVFLGPSYPLRVGRSHLEECFPLICIQRLSLPNFATERCHWHDSSTTTDRDRTVSRRSEPSSRTALIGEQPNPWNLLQLQDAMSRHRGAKPERRYELLAPISLLSPAYLLSVERWPFHAEPPDH